MQKGIKYVSIKQMILRWNAMNHVNLSYDYIAAFFLFMLLMWYFFEKKVPLRSYRYFALFCICLVKVLRWMLTDLQDSLAEDFLIHILRINLL